MIDGTPLVDEEDGVREFLGALHAFDVGELPVRRPDWLETCGAQCDEFRRLVLPALDVDVDERPHAEALFAEVESPVDFEPVLTHSDLGPEHLLCRDGRLVGVIDRGDARVGDPALDYSWLSNGPFPHRDVDEDLRRRARFYHRLAPWFGAHFDVLCGRAPELGGVRARL